MASVNSITNKTSPKLQLPTKNSITAEAKASRFLECFTTVNGCPSHFQMVALDT